MKKTLALFLALMMILTLCSCGGNGETAQEPAGNPSSAADGDTPDFSGRELVMGVWGGTYADAALEAYVEPFEEMTGATITLEEYGADVTVKIISQEEQGMEGIDIVTGCGVLDQMAMMADAGALMKLDYSQMPNSEYVDAKYDYCVGQYIMSGTIAWNEDVYGDDPPDTMAKYFDVVNYPGNRGECGFSPTGRFESILLANGVEKEDLYPIDEERAWELFNENNYKDSVTVWWDSGSTIRQALADGEVDCGVFWGGSIIEAIKVDGLDNIGVSFDNSNLVTDCMAIASTCSDPELAHAFVDYCLSAEAQAKWSELKFYAPVNPQAYDLMDPELVPYFPTSEENVDKTFWCDVDYWTENFERITDDWLEWIAS